MNIPDRVQASRQHKEPEGTKRVCRPSKYGNDYIIFAVSTKGAPDFYYVKNNKTGYMSRPISSEVTAHKHAVEMFAIQMETLLATDPAYYDDLFNYEHISCFCLLHLPCHCDPIIEHLKRRAAELEQVTA